MIGILLLLFIAVIVFIVFYKARKQSTKQMWVWLNTLCYTGNVLGSGTAYALFLHIVGMCEYDLTLYAIQVMC